MEERTKIEKWKSLISLLLIFIIVVTTLVILMVGVAKIPKKLIKDNMMESANYLLEKPMYYQLINDQSATIIDHYADSITLNIVYNLDETNSLKSVLYSKYYGNNGNMETENLLATVSNENCNIENQYIRYWHGEMIILKVLLLFFNIEQIYIINAIILIILTAILSYLLIKNKMKVVMIGLIIAMIVTNSFVVPFALEYISMYLVMLISSINLLYLLKKGKDKYIIVLFFLTGIFTCFFDFLTIETVTLTVPLIILLVYKYKDSQKLEMKAVFKLIIKVVLIWIAGYVLMWATKWGISAIYLNENLKDVVFENAIQRIEKGNTYTLGATVPLSNYSIIRNVQCLFPICLLNSKNVVICIFLFLLFTFLFFMRKEKNIKLSLILFGIGLVPYIRYVIINGHSLVHYFFTYRAQIATIIALIVGSYYMIDMKLFRRKNKCKKK